jgi:tetratricopeptide (TPR) repeat protein
MKKKVLMMLVSLCFIQADSMPPIFHKINHYHIYMWGYYNQFQDNPSIAQQCFESVINTEGSIYAYTGYIHHLYETNHYDTIIKLMPSIDEALQNHAETQLTFIKALELTDNQQAADKKIMQSYPRFTTNPEFSYGAALAHMRNNNPSKALAIINSYLDNSTERPTNFIFYFLKAQLYLSAEQKQLAYENIQKSLELNPSFDQGWLLSGLIHELEGNIDQAIAGYQNFLQLVGHDKGVEQQLINLLLKRKHTTQFVSIKKSFEEALRLYREKQFSQSLQAIEHCLQKEPSYKPARLLKIELLCALNQADKGLQLLASWIAKNEHDETWFRALHLLYQAGIEQNKIIALLKNIEEKNPHNLLSVLYLADIYLKNRIVDKGSMYLKKALPLSRDNQLREKILYQLGALYFEQHELEGLAQVITQAMTMNLKFPPLLNLAAYYFATNGNNIPKAQELLNSALAYDAQNPHYLDTQALIWYKQQEYEKAHKLLNTLANQQPHDFFIKKHLSKIEYKLGKKEHALTIMKQALTNACPLHEKQKCHQLVNRWSNKVAHYEP